MYSINVIVITYNQENYIGRALDSILCQRDYGLRNIVVVDDCSTDGNWAVISEYVERYPMIVKAYRNEKNLGIYANVKKSSELRGEADFFCRCSGDDALRDGWFKAMQECLESKIVNPGDAFLIQGDYMTVQPDGKEFIVSQKGINNIHTPLEILLLRGVIHGRSTIQSKALQDKYDSFILDKGLNLAETYADIQKYKHADFFYYIPYVGSIYYTRIGVAKSIAQQKEKYDEYWIKENIIKWEYFRDNEFERKIDKNYANFSIKKIEYEKSGKLLYLICALVYRMLSIDVHVDNATSLIKDFYHLVIAHKKYNERFDL